MAITTTELNRYMRDLALEFPEVTSTLKRKPKPLSTEAPLCECGCGEPVRSSLSGVWSRYRGNHWMRTRGV